MATVIDQKIVQMKFDNKEFEDGVRDTMTLLQKFKAALGFSGATKGLEDINKAAKKVDLSNVVESANAVSVKFDAMQVVAITALQNITNTAMNAGQQIIKSLTIDQVTSGFAKYEDKLTSVRTIMNATGLDVKEVNKQLERLNWFTDQTSYNFVDMVSNIGKFTNAGIDLDKSVTAMEGIANWAAISGQGINEAGRAMYNLAQAMAVGKVKLMDWKSIENANMSTIEFKQNVIDAAVKLGTLKKVGEGYVTVEKEMAVSATNFNEALSEGWFTSDVLMAVLTQYGSFADTVYNTVQETSKSTESVLEAFAGKVDTVGARAFAAAQEYKTLNDAINATKDAVSTGWMQSFELIIGDTEQAKEVWTAVGEEIYDIFASGLERQNKILRSWSEWGGRDTMIGAIGEAYTNIRSVFESVHEAFVQMFPPYTLETVQKLTTSFANLVKELTPSQEALYTIYVTVKAILTPFRLLFTVVKNLASVFGMLAVAGFKLADSFLAMWAKGNPILDLFKKIFGEERFSRLAESFSKIIQRIGNFFSPIVDAVKELLTDSEKLSPLATFMQNVLNILKKIGSTLLDWIVVGVEKLANFDFTPISNFFKSIGDAIKSGFGKAGDIFQTMVENFKVFTSGLRGEKPANILEGIGNAVRNIKDRFVEFIHSLGQTTVAKTAGEWIGKLADFFKELGSALLSVIERLTPARILLYSFGVSMVSLIYSISGAVKNLSSVFTSLSKMFDSFGGVMDALASKIGGKKSPIEEISKSILMLVASVVLLTMIDPAKLTQATETLITVSKSLAGVFAVISLFGGLAQALPFINLEKFNDTIRSFSVTLIAISGSLTLLSAALLILDKVDMSTMPAKLAVVAVIVAAIGAVIFALTKIPKFDNDIIAMVASIAAIAVSLNLVIGALNKLEIVDPVKLISNLAGVTLILIALKKVLAQSYGIRFDNALGILATILSLTTLARALQSLSKFDMETLVMGVVNLIPVFVGLAGVCAVLRILGKDIKSITSSILNIGIATLALAAVIKIVSGLSLSEIGKGLLVVGAVLAFFKIFNMMSAFIFTVDEKGLKDTFVGLGIAMLALSAAIAVLGTMKLEVVIQGTAVVGALIALMSLIVAASKGAQKVTGTIISITGAVIAMAAAVAILSLLEPEEAKVAVASMAALMVTLGTTMRLIGNGQFSFVGMLNILEIAVLFAALGAAMVKLSEMNLTNVTPNLLTLSECLISLSICVAVLNKASELAKSGGKELGKLVLMIAGLGGIGIILSKFSEFINITNIPSMLIGIAGMTTVILSLSACFSAIALISKLPMADKGELLKIVGLISLLGAIGTALTAVFGLISNSGIDYGNMFLSISGMTTILLALSVCLSVVNLISMMKLPDIKTFGKVIGLMALLAGFGEALIHLVDAFPVSDTQAIISTIGSMSLALIALSATLVIMSAAAFVASKIDIKSFGYFMAILGATVAVGGVIAYAASKLDPKEIQNGAQVLLYVGEAIGNFVGGIIGGVVGGTVAGVMDNVSIALANFVTNAEPFIELMTGPDGDKLAAGIGALASMLLALTADSILSGIGRLIGGNTSLTRFGEELSSFGENFKTFGETLNSADIDTNKLDKLISSASKVVDFATTIPPQDSSGTLRSWLSGDTSLSSFGKGLSEFANGISSIDAKALNFEISDNTVNSFKKLTSFAATIPQQGGGLKGWLTGDVSLKTFGEGFKSFAQSISDINEKALDFDISQGTIDAYKRLTNFAGTIPSQPSWLQQWFKGDTSLSKFGEELSEFGSYIARYYMRVEDITDPTIMTNAIEPLGDIIDVASSTDVNKLNVNVFKKIGEIITEMTKYPVSTLPNLTNLGVLTVRSFVDGLTNTTMVNSVKKAIEDMLSAISDVFTNKSALQKSWGEHLVIRIAKGIESKIQNGVNAVEKLCDEMTLAAEKSLGINSPSKVFAQIGNYITQGLAKGITENQKKANNAIETISKSIISSVRSIFQIHSPSVVMEEMGHYIVQGLAEGIYDDMSAVEAASQMAKNITNAFKAGFDEADLDLTTLDLEQKLYEAMHAKDVDTGDDWFSLGADNSQKKLEEKKMETLEKKMQLQAKKVAMANAQYQATIMAVGENTEEAQSSYNTYLQEMIDLASLAKEILGDQEIVDQNVARRNYYDRYVKERDQLMAWGFTEDEIKAYLRSETGFLDGNIRTVETIVNEYLSAVEEVVIDSTLEEAMANAISREVATSVSKGTEDGMEEALSQIGSISSMPSVSNIEQEFQNQMEEIVNGLTGGEEGEGIFSSMFNKEDFAGSLASMFDLNLDWFNTNGEGFINNMFDFGKNALNNFLSAWGIEIGSKDSEFSEATENVMDGMENVIIARTPDITDALSDMSDKSIKTVREKFDIHSPSKVFEDIGTEVVSGLVLGVSENSSMMLGAIDDMTEMSIHHAIEKFTEAYQAFDVNLNSAMANTIENTSNSAYMIGSSLIDGMVRGIDSNKFRVFNSATILGNSLTASLSTSLGIHSPSTVARRIAMFFDMGFANGLSDYSDIVKKASEDVGQETVEGLNETISKASEMAEDVLDGAPVIRPVLDLEELKKDMAEISGMFSTEQAIGIQADIARRKSNEEIQNGVDSDNGDGTSFTFVQNNYSPKALSRAEIYRQTNNQFAAFKERVSLTR